MFMNYVKSITLVGVCDSRNLVLHYMRNARLGVWFSELYICPPGWAILGICNCSLPLSLLLSLCLCSCLYSWNNSSDNSSVFICCLYGFHCASFAFLCFSTASFAWVLPPLPSMTIFPTVSPFGIDGNPLSLFAFSFSCCLLFLFACSSSCCLFFLPLWHQWQRMTPHLSIWVLSLYFLSLSYV